MPNPRNRHSKGRRDRRRTHDALEFLSNTLCANCGSTKMPHRVCPSCGFYRGKQVLRKQTEN